LIENFLDLSGQGQCIGCSLEPEDRGVDGEEGETAGHQTAGGHVTQAGRAIDEAIVEGISGKSIEGAAQEEFPSHDLVQPLVDGRQASVGGDQVEFPQARNLSGEPLESLSLVGEDL